MVKVQSLYIRNATDVQEIHRRAKAAGLSVSSYLVKAGTGELVPGTRADEAVRQATQEIQYWRERFEQMAALMQSTQAELLQLRAEVRMRDVGPSGVGAGEAGATALAPRLLVVFTSLRSADSKYRVWTETELLDELGLDLLHDAAAPERLRAALAALYRTNLIEPQRNGWRYRGT